MNYILNIIFLIVYELDIGLRDLNCNFTLKDCLLGVAKLAKNAVPYKYVYAGFGLCSVFYYLTVAWLKMPLFLELI